MAANTIRIAHLSDIHFGETNDGFTPRYKHDLRCLRRIQQLLDRMRPEVLVVSGDITNIGDKLNLERAYQWIHDRIYVDGEYYGLEWAKKGIKPIIVPGNHDAFNAPTNKSNLHRWQSSLRNYYAAFPEYSFEDPNTSVDYTWVSKGSTDVFVCRLDSCFLGDPETDRVPGSLSLTRVAKGKISLSQSERILRIYDQGVKGELRDENKSLIPPGRFMRSLKILVMHHYLFEPNDARAEPLLQLNDKRSVFQNLAMCDFDVLLCGHKHIEAVQILSYLDHFDSKAKIRLAFNYVRRSLGICSLPIRRDADGRPVGKLFRFVLGYLYLSKTKGQGLTEASTNEIISVLERSLQRPSVLKEELVNYSKGRWDLQQTGLFDDQEVRELYTRIQKAFNEQQQKHLMKTSATLKGMVGKLAGRAFAHISAASSAKSSETTSRGRAINIYDICDDTSSGEHKLVIQRFPWDATADGQRGDFQGPVTQTVPFRHDRSAIAEMETA